ncbi:MAG TPA: 1,4-alpha-glucan branching protein GlgB [Synergistales bacterium]|nr:1,4-alpha-glucan branching protein GlgB [Synergistales bacterium]HQO83813.1 1,4-alpha-glucan branching protein GlgB [Synergistales bacterium]HQQ11336.1 1,4-alpha-glucan branching protein GlgB [Synergistales bacterium]
MRYDTSLLTEQDIYLFREGRHCRLYERLGAHFLDLPAGEGTHFAVWAPAADLVSVIGDFNGWDSESFPLKPRWDSSGIWEGFVPGVSPGALYKYSIRSGGSVFEKGDPFAFLWETAPKTASVVWKASYEWKDEDWMAGRGCKNSLESPISVYEVHPGSWRRGGNGDFLSWREMAPLLAGYAREAGFTHVELLPVMEHPFYGSWGYQTLGYFAPTSRFGRPEDLMFLIDTLHQEGLGVILDWVPSHFPNDPHGLARFDGTCLFEHSDPRKGFHPDWKSCIFNYGRHEVRSFLLSSASFWADRFHADGIRVDAVASMLYLDYSRKEGEWLPNIHGGKENLEAIQFLRDLNTALYRDFPGIQTFAEESTAWPMVTRPVHTGGLGFGFKWNMGWMHDSLKYMSKDPVFRKYEHDSLTFSAWYAFSENFVLPLSHDEVVHGKGSLLGKMPGDEWQRFANLRLLFGYMFAHPGKKLLFMGGEFAQGMEWDHDSSLDWHLAGEGYHAGVKRWVEDLNRVYGEERALHELDCSHEGFRWVDARDSGNSVISFLRFGRDRKGAVLAVCNFTPVPRYGYVLGVPFGGRWREILNSDAGLYGGSGTGNLGGVEAEGEPSHGFPWRVTLTLPPLGVVFLGSDLEL